MIRRCPVAVRGATVLLALAAASTGRAAPVALSSSAFPDGAAIPAAHTCDGEDASPPLVWTDPPPGTRSLALVCEDPDAPGGLWVHWVLADLPAAARTLPRGIAPDSTRADGSRQGRNDFGRIGYGGPCPPRGKAHRYVFRLLALDVVLAPAPGFTRAALVRAAEGHVLGTAELSGRYARP